MGSVLASSVWRDVQVKDAEHPDGWPAAQKAALAVMADQANYRTGRLLSSMATLAALSGWGERTMRRAADRALAEGLILMEGYYLGKSRSLRFPNPRRIGEPDSVAAPNRNVVPLRPVGEPDSVAASNEVGADSDPDSDPDSLADIPVVPVVPVVSGEGADAVVAHGSGAPADGGLTVEEQAEERRLKLVYMRRKEAEHEAALAQVRTEPNANDRAILAALEAQHAAEDAATSSSPTTPE